MKYLKAMYVMIEGNHVYTLNDELQSLKQLLDAEKSIIVTASSDFHISDRTEKSQYKMVSCANDILDTIKEVIRAGGGKWKQTKKVINVIHKENYLTGLFYELRAAGYKPGIDHSAGQISKLSLSFKYRKLK